MKNYEVKITPYALEQMAEIRDYIVYQLQNPDAARVEGRISELRGAVFEKHEKYTR